MIYIDQATRRRLTGKSYLSDGILVQGGVGWYSTDVPDLLQYAKESLQQGMGWNLKGNEPEVYEYVKENFPEELI